MKNSQLYIEQVLIGLLIIVMVAAPFLPEWLATNLAGLSAAASIASGSLLLGTAFWLGIPFDRLADTLLDRLNGHNRLRFVLTHAKGVDLPTKPEEWRDKLFAEDRARIGGLREGGAVADWINYHSSRIRLTRALAVYGPALTLTLTVGVVRVTDPAAWRGEWLTWGSIAAVSLGYLLWALLTCYGRQPPRSEEPAFIQYARDCGWVDGARIGDRSPSYWAVWEAEWVPLLVPASLLVASVMLASCAQSARALLVALGGSALSVLSAWSWGRITKVSRTSLRDFDRFPRSGSVKG